jgi:sugar-specific transcriptional regulator TrmB
MTESKIFDQTENKQVLKSLESFGLSSKEATVYFALLPRRDAGSSKLVQATGLHKQFVYNALSRLEELGLARHVLQNGRKKFSATTPNRLLSLAEEKKLAAQALAKQLESRFAGAHEHDFEVIQGESAFLVKQFQMMERLQEGSTIDVITGPNDRYMKIFAEADAADDYDQLRIKKNIRVRYVGPEEKRDDLRKMEEVRPLWEYRIFPGLSTGLVDMSVWPDCILLNIYGSPVLSFVITGKDIAEGYREFFEAIWKLSSK